MNSPRIPVKYVEHSKVATADVSSSNLHGKSEIYVLKIKVVFGEVPIWRMVEVPSTYSFFDLHVVIQDSLGWEDSHLHQFTMQNPIKKRYERIGIPDDWLSKSIVPEKNALIANYFSPSNTKCNYEYDFGSPWKIIITLEKIIPVDPNVKYPRCVSGQCSSPPEDSPKVGLSWIDIPFDRLSIQFRDPVEAWKDAFQTFNK